MPSFKQGDVIKVPFPYTDRPARQYRPALVVSTETLATAHSLLWVLMITSAANRGWPGDLPVSNLRMAGLPVASVIRTAKIATIESGDATRLGKVPALLMRQVSEHLGTTLGLGAA